MCNVSKISMQSAFEARLEIALSTYTTPDYIYFKFCTFWMVRRDLKPNDHGYLKSFLDLIGTEAKRGKVG